MGGDKIKTLPVANPTLITTQEVRWSEMPAAGIIGLLPVFAA